LKIGGSVITDKSEELKARTDIIDRLATEIQRADLKNLIIVHGGGSFGHPIAERYCIKEGLKAESQKIHFCETHHFMTVLNGLLMDALICHNVQAISVTPSSVMMTENGRINSFDVAPLKRLLEMAFLPVMYGDAVLDTKLGFTILSGDQLVSSLAMNLDAEHIIMGVDVDGLYSADPKVEKTANMFECLTLSELEKLQNMVGKSTVVDVTGGMLGKITELSPAISHGIPVTIVNALEPDRVYDALKKQAVKGTLLRRE
jgi:isopentenyl phosphate kinase